MKEEGFIFASERTINRILNNITEERITEELKRQQLRDITTAESPIRLRYRDKMLEKLMPKKTESRVESKGEVRVSVDRGEEIEELLQRYDHLLIEAGDEEDPLQEDDPGEPVHTQQTDG